MIFIILFFCLSFYLSILLSVNTLVKVLPQSLEREYICITLEQIQFILALFLYTDPKISQMHVPLLRDLVVNVMHFEILH